MNNQREVIPMQSRRRLLLPAATLLAAIALVLAGCQSNSSTGSQSGGGQSSGGDGQTLSFATPAAGAPVASPVKFSVNVSGTQIGQPETGKMHLHIYVDNSSKYQIVYATSGQVDMPAGMHTLKAVLAQPNHSETNVNATQQVQVTGGGQAPATTANDGGGGGYGYP
jgi:hypothetical protein